MKLILHKCPTCGAEEGEPCRTPKGRKKETVHDTRPFSLDGVAAAPDASDDACSICGAPYTGALGLGPCANGHTLMEEVFAKGDQS